MIEEEKESLRKILKLMSLRLDILSDNILSCIKEKGSLPPIDIVRALPKIDLPGCELNFSDAEIKAAILDLWCDHKIVLLDNRYLTLPESVQHASKKG